MEHVRIDEGVKRGRRKRTPRAPIVDSGQSAIPADLDPKYVLDLYLQHPTTSGIAQKLGVRRSTLTLWLREHCPEDWRNVQVARALMRKEDADQGIETAGDALSLARAREMLRSGQWDLERLDSGNYGQKQQTQVTVSIGIASQAALGELSDLIRSASRVIEGECTVDAPDTDKLLIDKE